MTSDHGRVVVGRHVVGGDDRRREQHPAHDRQLPGQIRRSGAFQNRIRQQAAEDHPDRRADVRQRRHESGLNERHAARRHEVGGKPGDEEDLCRIAPELSNRGAHDLPLAEQQPDMAPLEPHRLTLVLAAAARLDVVALGLVDGGTLAGVAIQQPPDDAEGHTERADNDEQPTPAEPLRDPEQRHTEKPEAHVLSERIDRVGAGALVLRKPRREHPAVGRKTRRFENPHADARHDQAVERTHGRHQRREERPEHDGDEVRDARPEPVEEDSPGICSSA